MRRICCFCERWESGGIESFLCNVLTRMDMSDLAVDIVASSIGKSVFTDPLRRRGVQFHELSGNPRNIPENRRRFRALIRERRYDVLHVNAFQSLSLEYLKIAEQEGVPVRIAHSHNTALRKSLMRPAKQLLHAWARRKYTGYATDLWACAKDAAKFLFARHDLQKRGFAFIPNGIDVERFRFDPIIRAQVRTKLGVEDQFVIGHIGRLCYQKNQAFLLDVLAEAVKREPSAVLLLVGDGEDRAALRKKAAELHISDKVIFYGTSAHPEHLLWAMDAFAMPSRFEGLPVTAIEAQASGLPCFLADTITTECKVTAATAYLPLSWPESMWAEELLKRRVTTDRRRAASEVGDAGFDSADVAKQIQFHYLGMNAHEKSQDKCHYPGI